MHTVVNPIPRSGLVKYAEETMKILEYYDLTQTYRNPDVSDGWGVGGVFAEYGGPLCGGP